MEHIEELSPQCHPDFRSDAHKIDYLRKAVAAHKEWSQTPIQRITSGGLTFNGFVTALHEAIQNLKEIKIITCQAQDRGHTGHTEADETCISRYGRNPKWVQKKGYHARSGSHSQNRNSGFDSNRFSRSFEESRRRNECHKCAAPWKPGHYCKKGAIRNNIRGRVKKGEPAIHIVSEMVQGLEGELDIGDKNDLSDGEDHSSGDATDAHYGTASSDLKLFDSLTSGEQDTYHNEIIESIDKEYFTNHLAANMKQCFMFAYMSCRLTKC